MKPFDEHGHFAPTVPPGGTALRRMAVRGAGATIASGALSLMIQVLATVVLSRILAPRDFGLVAMVTTFSLLLMNYGANSVTDAVVQCEELTHELASNLFWVSTGIGLLMTGGFAVLGHLMAWFYKEPLVAPITYGISVTIVLANASALHIALLKRAMRFSTVALNDIVAKAVSVAVSVTFGLMGWGHWALVLGACAYPLCLMIGSWILCRWMPGLPRNAAGSRKALSFSTFAYGRFSINYFARNADNMLVGWRFGAGPLGFYKKAYDLFSLSASQLTATTTSVAVSALSRVRNDAEQYNRYLIGSLSVMAFLGMGISGAMTLIGRDVIRLLLGPGWETAGEIFICFAPGIGMMVLYCTHSWIHLSNGRADRWFKWGILEWTVTIALFLCGLPFGPHGIALAWCASYWLLTVPALWYAAQPIQLRVSAMVDAFWRYIVAAAIACLAGEFFVSRQPWLAPDLTANRAALRVAVLLLFFLLLYLAAVAALHRGFSPMRRIFRLLGELRSSARPESATPAACASTPLRNGSALLLVLALAALTLHAQPARTLLPTDRAIDWTHAGVGEIPARPVLCATLTPASTLADINAALAACPAGQTVYLSPGAYSITGTVRVPSNVTLRGAGADQTILNAIGKGQTSVVTLGDGYVPYKPLHILSGATARSTSIEVDNSALLSAGMHLVIAETNNPAYVSSAGDGGNCNWCDGEWTPKGTMARGQIVEITAVRGRTITFAPGLYSAYSLMPVAVPFNMQVHHAGVEDLQIYANNTGYGTSFRMATCAYCWIKGVESNYADGDLVQIYWGFHDEVRDSYFSNAFLHVPGVHDSDIQVALKTSESLIENNIIERTHASVMLEWGAAGNVVAYNYAHGEFDTNAPNLDIGGIDFHGAHPQFNLIEGNIFTKIGADSTWGSASHTTVFRNWVVGANKICSPMRGRGTVDCSGANAHYGFQAARAIEFSAPVTQNNFVGNVLGSAQMQSLMGYNRPLAQHDYTEYPAARHYDGIAFAWSFGYGANSDDGTGTGCGGGQPPCHAAGTAATNLFHGNYSNISGTAKWMPTLTHQLPASLYLANKPSWWGALPFPATGPDVNGGSGPGGHTHGNPAYQCYTRVMGGSDGGAGSPLRFNARSCYSAMEGPRQAPGSNKP